MTTTRYDQRVGRPSRGPAPPRSQGRPSTHPPTAARILQLQRTAGNRAVTQLLAAPDRRSVVQRAPEPDGDSKTPSAQWYEVNDAHQKLFTELGNVNLRVVSPTRGDWMTRVSTAWGQLSDGVVPDDRLPAYAAQLAAIRAEIAQESAQARESWLADEESYQQERRALQAESYEWVPRALKILDGSYSDTARSVQIAGSYLTFDDLLGLEHTLAEKKHRQHAQARWAQDNDGPATGTTLATGAGLGAIVTYQGKTLVQLGGQKFYVSGTPPKGGWIPKGGTTSSFFLYKKDNIKKMYRLDWDTIKMGPKQGQLGWEHNQQGVAKVLKLTVTNHQPAGGWARAAGKALRIYKWGGRAMFVAGLVGSALEIYYAENKARAIAKTGGALVGGIAGAKLGAAGGGKLGAYFGPVGAGVGAFLGGLVGGALGAWGGSKATEYVYDLFVEPLEAETDWVLLTEDQVEPVPGAAAP